MRNMPLLSPGLEVVVAGSFSVENMPYIREAIGEVAFAGAQVIAPASTKTTNPDAPFIILETDDPALSPRELETIFMDKIATAGLLLIVNHNPRRLGRVGLSAAAEMACAAICGVPFTTTNAVHNGESLSSSLYFSNDVTTDESGVLYRISEQYGPVAPMSPDEPDYIVLANLRDRLLMSLAGNKGEIEHGR